MLESERHYGRDGVHNSWVFGFAVLGLGACALLLFAVLLENLYGAWLLEQSVFEKSSPRDEFVVGVVESNVRRLWSPAKADEQISAWESFLRGMKVSYERVDPSREGFEADLDKVDLLLVLTPQGLTDTERVVIHDAMSRGIGTLFSVSAAMREDESILLQSGFWRDLLNTNRARVKRHTKRTFLPFSSYLPFGVSLVPGDGLLFEPGMLSVTFGDGDSGLSDSSDEVDIRWGHRGTGRWVVLSFDPSGISSESKSRKVASRILADAFEWLRLRPFVRIANWPQGKHVASVMTIDVSGRAHLIESIDRKLQQMGIRATYFHGGRGVEQRPPKFGEVAYKSPDPELFVDREESWMRDHLQRAKDALAPVAPVSGIEGFMPPGEVWDEATITALIEAGYSYLYAGPLENRRVPDLYNPEVAAWEFWRTEKPLVLIPRTAMDDVGVYLERGTDSPEAVANYYLEELEHAERIGGLLTIALHADYFESPSAFEALAPLAEALAAEEVWNATAGEVAAWWRRRARIILSKLEGPPHRVVLGIANVSDEEIEDLVIDISLPGPADTVSTQLSNWRHVGLRQYQIAHIPGADSLRLLVPSLGSGADETVHLEWR